MQSKRDSQHPRKLENVMDAVNVRQLLLTEARTLCCIGRLGLKLHSHLGRGEQSAKA